MTITAQTSKTGPYSGNGTTTVFAYTFEVQDEAHLVVDVLGVDGITVTRPVVNVGYTVTGVGNAAGGTIVMTSAPAIGEQLTITRSVPIDQEIDLENRRSVAPEVLEDGFDKLTQIAQDQQEQLDRTIKIDLFETADLDQLVLNINAVAAIESDVSAVAAIDGDVQLVAAIDDKVVIAADNVADITNFADVYLGPAAADPATRTDGSALQTGDLYFNTVSDQMLTYSGSAWVNYEADAVAAKTAAETAETNAETAQTAAETAQGLAETAQAAAEAAQAGAELAETNAETARDAAFVNADVYADTAAGLAATAVGDQFQVVDGEEIVRYRHDSGPVATEVARYPSASYVDDIYRERFFASQSAWVARSRTQKLELPKAAVVVLLGQSNNAPRGTAISGTVSRDVFMPFAGNATAYFPFNATNAEWTMSWTDVASAVQHQEGASETPCSGVAIGLLGAGYQRVYICSAAIGARTLEILGRGGPAQNMHGLVMRLCDLARAAGYEPEVMFDVHHGEADATAGTSEANYYALGMAYYSQARAHAAHAMDKPEYNAPIVFHTPIAGGYSGQMVPIQKAIVRLAKDLPNAMLAGGSFQFPTETDRVHQEETGYRMRGEQGGYLLRDWSQGKGRHQSLYIVEAKWSGTTCTVLFNKEIVRDTGVDYGTNLNTSFALAGLEFLDDGSYIQITNVAVQGRSAVLTLASTPAGTTQLVRIASQTITGTLTAGSNNLPGTQIRSTEPQRLSIYDYTFDIGDFATPQEIEATP